VRRTARQAAQSVKRSAAARILHCHDRNAFRRQTLTMIYPGASMRILAALIVLAATNAHAATETRELVTAERAILCLSPGSLTEANRPEIARNQNRLRGLQCLRTGSGIPLTVIERSHDSIWKVSFRPQGISGGVTLWGRVSSFATPDGGPLLQPTRVKQ
jgi:hypothetical protein